MGMGVGALHAGPPGPTLWLHLVHMPFSATQGFNFLPANRERWARITWTVEVVRACRGLTSLLPHSQSLTRLVGKKVRAMPPGGAATFKL